VDEENLEPEDLTAEERAELEEIERRERAARRSLLLRGLLILLFASLIVFIAGRIVLAFLENPNRQIVTAGLSDALVIVGQIQATAESMAIAVLAALGGLLIFSELDRRLIARREVDSSSDMESAT